MTCILNFLFVLITALLLIRSPIRVTHHWLMSAIQLLRLALKWTFGVLQTSPNPDWLIKDRCRLFLRQRRYLVLSKDTLLGSLGGGVLADAHWFIRAEFEVCGAVLCMLRRMGWCYCCQVGVLAGR